MASRATQKALLVTEVGKPLSLTTTWPVPQPGPNQIQVRITVAGINPHDQKARDNGLFIKDALPAVLAMDVVGRVTALGSGVTKYQVGDRVVGHPGFAPNWAQCGLQEYAVLDADYSAKIPEGFSDDDGATLPTNIIAPLVALFDESALGLSPPWADTAQNKDVTLLVIGGGSSCGKFGVQLAHLAGVGRIVVVGGDETELTSYGATDLIDRHAPSPEDLVERIRAVVGDDLLHVYDAINPTPTQFIGINALSTAKRGKFARLLPSGGIPDESKIRPKQQGYDLINVFGSSHAKPDICKPFWDRVPRYLTEKKIKPLQYTIVEEGLDADRVNEVLDAYRAGKRVTKTHVHVS